MGAVTAERTAEPGSRWQSLCLMRYVPVSTAAFVERYFADGFTAVAAAKAPSLAWNREDALQDMLLCKAFRRAMTRPVHYVPTPEGFRVAVHAELGWACSRATGVSMVGGRCV